MTRVFFVLLLVTVLVLGISNLLPHRKTQTENTSLLVVSSIYPLYEFAREVGGSHVTSTLITPSGVEPHEYEPTPKDILAISKSDLFLYVSPFLEPWAKKTIATFSQGKPLVLEASSITTLENNDPHIWLDPVIAIDIVNAIKNSLTTLDPTHANKYEANANIYIEKLKTLDQAYKSLSFCREKYIVTTHNAFRYLAKRYGFTVYPIAGLSPEDEPSAQKLAEIMTLVKEKNIRYIFYETLVANTIAETVSRQTGAKSTIFNPIEGLTREEMKINKTYIDIQNENIERLKLALVCQQ
ncbi:zinc ABC transporter substrate-binding protein [Candidatus Gottesmanbacteria bacterium]|nr:zinc ABC transporter substrate-binding protein [Candidatus Gottesmanbacteria bacterium]